MLRLFRFPLAGLVLVAAGELTGCASYYLHYGGFTAVNSSGQVRHFHVTWKTAQYPSWWFQGKQATPVVVTAQCSTRTWKLKPASESGCGKDGITACGIPGLDLNKIGKPVQGDHTVCMSVTDDHHASTISKLKGTLELTVQCYPSVTQLKQGDKTINLDYLKASQVPYSIPTTRAPLYSLDQGPEPFDTHVCKKDD